MAREVTLVCGPPCAGKSTWVADRAAPGDMVVDFDEIAGRRGPESVARVAAEQRRAALERQVAGMAEGKAWVIRTAADPQARERLAARLGATRVVVLNPGRHVAHERARTARRPPWTGEVIDRWYDTYAPAAVDTI